MNFFTKNIVVIIIAALMSAAYTDSQACGFQANQTSGCQGYVLNIQDTTVGAGSTASWNLTLPNGTHVITHNNNQFSYNMTIPGVASITMTDTVNGVPCSTTFNNIIVNPNPTLAGSFSSSVTCVGQCITWNDASSPGIATGTNCSPLSYLISWGLGRIDSLPGVCHLYTQNGTFSPSIVLTNSCGCTVDTTFTNGILVTAPPSASFTGAPLTSCTSPLNSTMTAPAPTTRDAKYFWYVDGVLVQANGSNIFTYPYPTGTHSVTLITEDSLSPGCQDTFTRAAYVTAGSQAAACFTQSVSSGCANVGINFCSCTPNAVSYIWSWTGGTQANSISQAGITANNPGCQLTYFYYGGIYSACLTVDYAGGCSSTTCDTFTLGTHYNLSLTGDTTSCQVPACIPVTYTGDPCPSCTFSWSPPPNTPNAPNGHTGTCYNVSTYGTISPGLTVTDTTGCQSSLIMTNYLNVIRLTASTTVTFLHNHGCANDTAVVTNTSVGGPFSSVIWDFPGGNVVSQNNAQAKVTYPAAGNYPYTMILQTASGCIDTLRDSIRIGAKPAITMSIFPQDVCYKGVNTFVETGVTSVDTPTSIIVWPEGLSHVPYFTIPPSSFDSAGYIYPDYGTFAFCYVAKTQQCPGDTICENAPQDSVRILAPITGFTKIRVCTNTDSALVVSTTQGADTSYWTFNGINYPNSNPNVDSFVGILPQCGIYYPISLTAEARTDTATRPLPHLPIDTVTCINTFSDSIITPCYGANFTISPTKGCYYAYTEPATITYTPNAYQATSVIWAADIAPNAVPNYIPGLVSFTQPLTLNGPGEYNICAKLTYPNGCIVPICKDSLVDISQPRALFAVSDTAGCVPFCVQFTNTSTVLSGAVASFSWNFGDGSPVDNSTVAPLHCYNTVGQFPAALTITDTNGCTNTFNLQMQANVIHADFTGVDSFTCPTNSDPRNPSVYTDASTGFVAHHQWLIPSSLGPTNPNPGDVFSVTEQYANTGCDSIGMVAIDQFYACRDTVWKHFCVYNPVARYSLPNLADTFFACPPAVISPFIDQSLYSCYCSWNFHDGNPQDTSCSPSHIWTVPGTYPVTYTAISCHGCVDSVTTYSITIGGPFVSMVSLGHGGCPCYQDTFIITSYNCDSIQFTTDGATVAFANFGIAPGTPANPSHDTVSFTYCNVGDVSPTILAIGGGCHVQYTNLIDTFAVDTPTTNFSYRVSPCGVDSVCFTKITTYSAHTAHDSTYLWTFGDGTTSALANPCHLYAAPGDYVVTLSVTNNLGCGNSQVSTHSVHVPGHPHAAFGVDATFGCSPLLVQFTDSSSVDDSTTIASGHWNFGDGTPVINNTASTSHTYTGNTTYTATLVIVDGYGCVDSAQKQIVVQGPPTETKGNDTTICLGDTARLSGSGSSRLVWLTNYNISDTLSLTPLVWPQVDTFYIFQVGTVPRCEVYDTIHVFISTIAILTDTGVNLCKGSATAFSATASTVHSTISNYGWSYGDGSFGVGQNTTHVYSNIGPETYTLIATNALGCKDTLSKQLTIVDVPHASFTLSLDTVCPNGTVVVTNTSTVGTGAALSTFTFTDPPLAPFSTPTGNVAYPTPGTYPITLIQTDLNQCADTVSQNLYVLPLPATYNIDTTICPGDTITLAAIGSNQVSWSPNYNIDNTSSVTPRVWPIVNTQYIAQVGGLPMCYVYDTVNVIMSTIAITADTALPACSNQASNFTAAATAVNATVSSYNWTFGDTHTGTGQNISHQFATYGTYNDVLIVTSSRGCKDTAHFTNIVYDIPHAALSISADSVCQGAPVTVTNLSTAGVSAALSTFYFDMQPDGTPDGTTSTLTYTFQASGNFHPRVVQMDLNGCVDTASVNFTVHALPVANFNNDSSCVNVDNQYISSSIIGDGPIQTYSWTINGTALGIDSSSINYTFPVNATENICLQVQDNFGCIGDTCKPVVILAAPIVNVTPLDTTICLGYSDTVNVTGNVDRVQWVPSVWVSNPTGTSVNITPRQTIDYQVYIYYKNCAPLIDTVSIWVIDSVPVSASADPQNIILGLSSNVTSTVKGTIDSIVWDPDSTLNCRNCMNPIATPHQTTTYSATVYYSKNGVVCSNKTSVTVTVYQSCDNSLIYVPNTFTPNGDGRNEVFRLRGQGITKVNYFRVYDRWGKLVYEATNADDPDSAAWNGGLHNDTGKPENSGVFVYVFEIQCVTGQTVSGKGNVTLIR